MRTPPTRLSHPTPPIPFPNAISRAKIQALVRLFRLRGHRTALDGQVREMR